MKIATLNRNTIKIIAMVTMFIDHLGVTFETTFPKWLYFVCRIIGRISLPLFAYFIAEGFFYTHNKLKYGLTLFTFGIIYHITYGLLFGYEKPTFNILFSFSFSTIIMFLYDKFFREQNILQKTSFCFILGFSFFIIYLLNKTIINISFGVLGIILPLIFYCFKPEKIKPLIIFSVIIVLKTILSSFLGSEFSFNNFITIFALLAIPFISLYNGKKGKYNIKYLFYWFYPLHRVFLYFFVMLF